MLRLTLRTLVATGLVCLLVQSRSTAQEAVRLSGRVLDETGGVLPGVNVNLHHATGEMTSVTDGTGTYRFEGVNAGKINLTFRLINFSAVHRELLVDGRETTAGDTVLRLALNADVVVTAAATFRNIVDIENPAEDVVGIAAAASQGAITARQLETRPVMRPGEVLEAVPGLIASQHSGEGKANQYYLRGFNLDHGTDFATTIAGVPVNTPTGAHSHGYTDTNSLIPELVSGVQFKKGPYFADEGDFSAAGAANINYVNALDRPIAAVSGGSRGWGRLLAAASPQIAGGHVLGAIELHRNDGPWVRSEDYRKINGLVRYSLGDTHNGFSATFLGYSAEWNATDQIPRRAVESGILSRFGHIDATDSGDANRQTVVAELQRSSPNVSTRATAFVVRNRLQLFSNFTYFLDDPHNGDQFEQSERRVMAGGRASQKRLGHLGDRHIETAIGVQIRRDWISPIGLYRTSARQRMSTTREDNVAQTMLGAYAQTGVEWTSRIRTIAGVRMDVYQFAVTSDRALNSGSGADALVSPKLTAILGPWARTELYANFGMGYHSNDARGAVIRVDPATGGAVRAVTPLVRAKGGELGIRSVRLPGLQSTVSLWYLDLDSELLFVGDAGTTEAGRPSRRAGIEWTNYVRLGRWLTADLDVSFSEARYRGDEAAGRQIPGALDRVVAGGLASMTHLPLFGHLRFRHFGPRPLTEDGSVRSAATTVWNAEAGVRLTQHARVILEGFNLLDARVSDIDYFYRSRLPGEPAEGVEDIHTHPALPRSVHLELQVRF